MKTRSGFVSNSSSSSFICAICGGDESGWDLCLSEAEMFECGGCGSVMHTGCADVSEDQQEEFGEHIANDRYGVDSKYCPICQLKILTIYDEMAYYRMRMGLENTQTLADIKAEFGSYEKFMEAYEEWEKNENAQQASE